MDIPAIEPTEITAGDTLSWRRSFSDYPASDSWVLSYVLASNSLDSLVTITAAADGDDHLVTVAASVSDDYTAGRYDWQAYVTKAAVRHTVGSGQLTIKPNFAAAPGGLDNRSQARRILEGLNSAYESYVTSRGHVAEYEIAGKRMKFRSAEEILLQISYWKRQVAAEEMAAGVAAGRRPGRVFVRFSQ